MQRQIEIIKGWEGGGEKGNFERFKNLKKILLKLTKKKNYSN